MLNFGQGQGTRKFQLGLVALTWSDWDSRWLDRVMPFLILLAAGGGAAFWNYFGFNRYKTI